MSVPMVPSPQVGIGQIGLGSISQVHRRGYARLGLSVAAGYDPDARAQARFATEAPGATVCSSVAELLADDRVGAIDLATPHHRHMRIPVLRQIAAAGKPVLIQKPLAMSFQEAAESLQVLEDAGVPAMVNQNMCFAPGAMAVERAVLTDRLVGEPAYAQIMMQYQFDTAHHPWFGRDDRWWTVGLTVHHLGLFQLLFGPPERVYALLGRDVSQPGVSRDGYGHLSLSYPSGLQVLIASTGTYYGRAEVRHGNEAGWVQGPEGVLDWSPDGPVTLSQRAAGSNGIHVVPIGVPDGTWIPDAFGLAMHHFQHALAEKATPWCSVADNLYVMAVIEAAYRSAAEGRAVMLTEVMGDLYDPGYGTGWSHATTTWQAPVLAPSVTGEP